MIIAQRGRDKWSIVSSITREISICAQIEEHCTHFTFSGS